MVSDGTNLRRKALNQDSQTSVNGTTDLDRSKSSEKMQERSERTNLVLWWRPFYTIWYFTMECKYLLVLYIKKLWANKVKVLLLLTLMALFTVMYHLDGPHQPYVAGIEKQVLWCGYWLVLGIMSSVGLGTGLHTFVLYLGPFIAKVTLAAYECNSLDFPEPPFPNSIVCPDSAAEDSVITLWSIMSKVRLEAMMWGAGTAIGELPPYFMARAAKLSGHEEDVDDDDIEQVLEMEKAESQNPELVKSLGILEKAKVYVHDLVHRLGFFGILACASIPNPLFDLAGITCGHFLVPFWTFFGATLIGKAVIKMHIQQLLVIFAFSQHHIESVTDMLSKIPRFGPKLKEPIIEYLQNQRAKLHKDTSQQTLAAPWLQWLFETIVIAMVAFFVVSIINSFAQNYHKRLCKERRDSVKNQ